MPTFDPAAKASFEKVRRAEESYARGLRAIARHIGHITSGFRPGDPEGMSILQRLLRRYSAIIAPWARNHAARMLTDVARRDYNVWRTLSRQMSRTLRREIETAPTGIVIRGLLDDQVTLITSLPTEAAQRVHKLTLEGLLDATRASEIAKEIVRTGAVTTNRANLIARTEVARTASVLVQARATYAGSDGYIWRSARDARVRKEHRELEGKYCKWQEPPIAGPNGERYHAGAGPNCRCYPEPIF